MVEIPTIREFYRNKTIFITGGSGFIGKVLVEKLLRSCPDLKTIYLLLREKKGRAPEDRIKTIIDLPVSRSLHQFSIFNPCLALRRTQVEKPRLSEQN